MTISKKSVALKEKQVKKLAEDILKAKTLMIVSIKNLPSKQFQEIKKAIRGDAKVGVAKKNIMLRALKQAGRESIIPLENYVQADCAFVISDKEGYDLAGILAKKKTPINAKAGQIAPDDIEVKAGPTDLVPGPAISELGALKIQIAVEGGKISIKAPRVIVNKGEVIKEGVASLLQKLNIQPFTVGLEPIVIYDIESEKIYTDIKIDSEGVVEKLKIAAGKALGFAQKIVFYCNETIGYFLAKANAEASVFENLKVKEDVDNTESVSEQKESNKQTNSINNSSDNKKRRGGENA